MKKSEFEDRLYGTLCCVYGMGLPRGVRWLATAQRIHRSTMLRRLLRLKQRRLVTCSAALWSVTAKGHQTVMEGMRRKSKKQAEVRWDYEFMGYVAWVSTDGKNWRRGSPEFRTQQQAMDRVKKQHGVLDANIALGPEAPPSQRSVVVR